MAERGLRVLAVRLEPLYHRVAAAVALVLSLGFVYSTWHFASEAEVEQAQIRFEFRASQVAEAIRGRMLDYEQVLRGGVGLFAASESVERVEWRSYVEHLRIEKLYPGIQGIGFAAHVNARDKARHEGSVRADGYPAYAIRPAGERAEYGPVTFIEPFDARNVRVFGFDMYSEAVRRSALERARDTGEASITGKVTLLQETDRDVQAGFLMFVPVYRRNLETTTVSQRRAAVSGYIYSPFRMDDLMRGILGEFVDVRLRIVDSDNLLFDSRRSASGAPAFRVSRELPVRGRTWRLELTSLPDFEATVDREKPLVVAAASAAASLLVLAIIWLLATQRARAVRVARSMTRDLRDSRERLALALEGSNQALFDWDVPSGRVVLSERWSRMTDCGPGGLSTTIGELEALIHPDDVEAVRKKAGDLIRGSIVFYQVEHRVKTASGLWRWILSQAKVVERDRAGRALRVAGTNVDVTERKEVERMKSEFIATVSHELRTPLTAIVGALGLLKEVAGGRLPAEAATFLGMAQQNSERLAVLINDVLDIEKIESGQMEFQLLPVPLGGLLERAVSLNAGYAEKFGVRLELKPAPAVTVNADENRLLQVLTNLMSNAVKYSPAGAAVTISAETRAGAVRVMVADRGPGVPEAFRDRIFGKFAQADSSDTRRKGGTGLGLSISRAIVEKHGGTIGYDSVPGQGATFYFDMPVGE